ncbi:hypothetical protein K437DRAFT_129830 [Tilletiaria anomala UBC 951]|uniref:Uncharacterized protein n=1 Tax=Tilletiaria anomala (strain ATCC 24038 / CBS 436.72 / UBC 951) TaxID=1037660 RepID=A0A066W1T1_TILAU|nr:uncharacterized protein K437DRAFT_129830 [Tilletiaria anomala UBC 951]KDN44745.1 hypothetical protein K437DRAFT_129830 [Tilletiaria anomala UBC 951]
MADYEACDEYDPAFDAHHYDTAGDEFQETLADSLAGLGDELVGMGISQDSLGGVDGMMGLGDSLGAELEHEQQHAIADDSDSAYHHLSAPGTPKRDQIVQRQQHQQTSGAGPSSRRSQTPQRTPRKGSGMESLADELTGTTSPARQPRRDKQRLAEALRVDLDEDSPKAPAPGADGDSLGAELGLANGLVASIVDTIDESMEEARIARIEAQQEAVREELEETLRMTDAFLSKLKERNTIRVAQQTSSASIVTGTAPDDTGALEINAAAILRLLQDTTKEREAQVRELKEMGIAFARPEAEWQAALADVAGIGDEADQSIDRSALNPEEVDSLGFAAIGSSSGDVIPQSDGASDIFSSGPRRAVLPSSTASSSNKHASMAAAVVQYPQSHKSTTASQMHDLQACTESLISSLGTMNEHAQVHRAAMNDASRKLRSLRAVLTQWRTEIDGVARSRAWIEEWESSDGSGMRTESVPSDPASTTKVAIKEAMTPTNRRPEDIKAWTQQQLERFEKILGDAEVRAKELLKPINMPSSFDASISAAAAASQQHQVPMSA